MSFTRSLRAGTARRGTAAGSAAEVVAALTAEL